LQNPIYKMVGHNIQKLRIMKGISQDDLAAVAGYHRVSIVNYEKGKTRITLDTLETIAKALDVPINLFFTESSSSEVQYWKKRIHCERAEISAFKIKS